jgi:hypothetical protein
MNTKKFYFEIRGHNVIDYVDAYSFVDAKARVFNEYSQFWNQIIWHDTTDPEPTQDTTELQERCARLFF